MTHVNPKNNPVQVIEADGTQKTIQVVGIADGYGNGLKANGKQTGTLFGDDIRTTRRVPIASGKFSQGLPLYGVNFDIVGSAYWQIADNGGNLNGAGEFGTGTDPNGKIYISTKGLNRYQPGQLSYYLFTAAWNGISASTGDFVALIGASLPGLAADGQDGDIKEGFMFGWKRVDGVLTTIIRIYKNFVFTDYENGITNPIFTENLSIYDLEVGYLGIHPLILYRVNTTIGAQELLEKVEFNSKYTSVNDPNMAISLYLENQGNDTNITINNGSFQYGNYAERPSGDPSSRPLTGTQTFASVGNGIDTIVGIYTVPDKVNMQSRLDSGGIGAASISEFRNTIRNKLKKVSAAAESISNKSITLSIYLVPIGDVSGTTFIPLNPYINVIEYSSVGTAILTNAIKIVELPDIRGGGSEDVRLEDYLLDGSLAGVITVTSTGNIADLRYTITTEDQF